MKKKNVVLLAFIMFFSNLIMADSPPWAGSSSYTFSDSDPYFSESYITNTASVDIIGGALGKLLCYESSSVIMDNGSADSLWGFGNSVIQLEGGNINKLFAFENSLITLYVDDYALTENPYVGFEAKLTGTWLNDNGAYDILISEGTLSHINIVPEPSTILLIISGLITTRNYA